MNVLQNSAGTAIPFRMLSSVDGQSGVTGLAAQVTAGTATWPVLISKAGAAGAAPAGAITEVDSVNYPGLYSLALASGDTSALGALRLRSRAQLTSPTAAPTLATATTGGSLPATTAYYVVYTITTGAGETLISPQASVTTGAGTTNDITVTAPASVTNATGYNVYVGTTSGGPYYLQQQGNTANTPFTSNFVVTVVSTAGANPPGANTAFITNEADIEHQVVAFNSNDPAALGLSYLSGMTSTVQAALTAQGYTASLATALGAQAVTLARLLGMDGDNAGIKVSSTDPTSGQPTAYDLYIYDTAAHATTNDGVTGLLYHYSCTAVYTSGKLTSQVTTRIQ